MLAVATLAAGRGETVRAALSALADALDVVESAGTPTATAIVAYAALGRRAPALDGIDGAIVLPPLDAESEGAAWDRALAALPAAEHALLVATDAAPAPRAVQALLDGARREDCDVVLASPAEPAPYALVRCAEIARLGGIDAIMAADPGAPPVLALARAVERAGGTVALVAGAGQALADTARPAPGPTIEAGCTLEVAHPEACWVGEATYFGLRSIVRTWAPLDRVRIGAYCSFADEVRLLHPGARLTDAHGAPRTDLRLRGAHRMDTATTFPMGMLVPDEPYDELPLDGTAHSRPQVIGSDVWVGAGALILGPVTIGHGAVIGARAVVTRDVAPYEVVVGNPAQVKRRRFDDATCDRLLALRWWEWPPAIVRGNHERFAEPVAVFLDRFDPAGALAGADEPAQHP